MRQQFPQLITQFNGFDDSVQILKNRGMIFEEKKPAFSGVKVYDDRPALTYSLDALDRGIRIELGVMGIDIAERTVKPEEFKQAEKKAKDNLEKDANHYLNLMSGESNKVDKHDKEKEVKRGAPDKDTFNDMKKATLKEGTEEVKNCGCGQDPCITYGVNESVKSSVKERLTEKLSNPTLLAAVKQIKAMHPEITSGIVDDFIDMHGQDILDGADPMEEFHNYIDANYEGPSDFMNEETDDEEHMVHELLGDLFAPGNARSHLDFSVEVIAKALEDNTEGLTRQGVKDAMDLYDKLAADGTLDKEVEDGDGFISSKHVPKLKKAFELIGLYGSEVSEKQGKDHDGDGDIDGDDYMAAKDKAIKKAMGKDPKEEQLKEAIKSIIKKTLLNEAATVKLADWAESYETFPGVKPVVNELENIVTEIETFYDKMADKIKNVFEKTSGFENEEGLKIGGFIAPSLESAFGQDLSKVIKKGSFFSKINLPKVRTITQADVDAHNSGERPLGETEIIEEPKSTVFTPNF